MKQLAYALALVPAWLVPTLLLPNAASAGPLYPNSVASNDLDFILADDPGACWSITRTGGGRTEMYDPRGDALFVEQALHFDAEYPGQTIRINVHPDVANPQDRAAEVAASVSKLPERMRRGLRYINILDADGGAFAEDKGRFFTLYDRLIERRLAEHDLDETVFHETAHVVLDPLLSADPDWKSNQSSDSGFVTHYAADNATREDIAESALFAWIMKHHPGRLPAATETAVRKVMPGRLEYLGNMLETFEPPNCPS